MSCSRISSTSSGTIERCVLAKKCNKKTSLLRQIKQHPRFLTCSWLGSLPKAQLSLSSATPAAAIKRSQEGRYKQDTNACTQQTRNVDKRTIVCNVCDICLKRWSIVRSKATKKMRKAGCPYVAVWFFLRTRTLTKKGLRVWQSTDNANMNAWSCLENYSQAPANMDC